MSMARILIFIVAAGIIASAALVFYGLSIPTANIISSPQNLEGPKTVTKVIDGDTVIVEGGDTIRLLGIDSDEKGYPCFTPAKDRIEELALGKEVYLEKDGEDKDQYGRFLRYIFLDGSDLNLQLVKEGMAVARFPEGKGLHRDEIAQAERYAKENRIGCKWGGAPYLPEKDKPLINPSSTPVIQPSIAPALPAGVIEACKAGDFIGQEKTVQGKVVQGTRSRTNTVFLNFGSAYPNNCFTAVIFSSDLSNFPEKPEDYYEGKTVKVTGKIEEYNGKPEIIIERKGQVEEV